MIDVIDYAFAEVNSKWKAMNKVKHQCDMLGVSVPPEVSDYLSIGNAGPHKCPPVRPKCCGQRVISTGIELIDVPLSTDRTTKGVLITLDEIQPESDYILLMEGGWNDRGFV